MFGGQPTSASKGRSLKSSRHLSQHLLKSREQDQLAREFPLLFGKTNDDRSTNGKYLNKEYSHRRSMMPVNENDNPNTTPVASLPLDEKPKRSVLSSLSRTKTNTPAPSKVVYLTSPQPKGVEMLSKSNHDAAPCKTLAQTDNDMDIIDSVVASSGAEMLNVDLPDLYPSRVSDVGTVDDVAVLTALRTFLHKMDANDNIQQTVESHFQSVDVSAGASATATEVNTVSPMDIEDLQTLSAEVAAVEGDVPDNSAESNARRSSLSSIATEFTVNSQKSRSSQFCSEHVPVTDHYISMAVGDKDVVHSSITEDSTQPSTDTTSVAVTASVARVEKVVLHPREQLLLQAMESGLVVADVNDHWQREAHVKFIIHVNLLHIPGVTDQLNGSLRMMLMKRFSDFKLLRQNLLISLRESSGESIPPLPTKQVLSMGSDGSDEDYLLARQKYLRNWLNSVMSRQSVEGLEFRKTIVDFFNN